MDSSIALIRMLSALQATDALDDHEMQVAQTAIEQAYADIPTDDETLDRIEAEVGDLRARLDAASGTETPE